MNQKKISVLVILILTILFQTTNSQYILDDFNTIIKNSPTINKLEMLNDGKILIVGNDLNYVNDKPVNYITKLNSDLSIDTTFSANINSDKTIHFYDLTANDSLIVAVSLFDMFVLNKDGRNYENFNLDPSISSINYCEIINNKLLLCCIIDNDWKLVMLNFDGTIYKDFEISNLSFNNVKLRAKKLENGKILISGMTGINGKSTSGIVRLNKNGTIDETFNSGHEVDGDVNEFSIQHDGKILLVGDFNKFNNTQCPGGIIRLNSDGSVDNSFIPGLTTNISLNGSYNILSTVDEKILVIGRSYFNGKWNHVIYRLNNDGSVDNSVPIIYIPLKIYMDELNMQLNNDFDIIVSGNYTKVNDTNCNGLAIFTNDLIQIDNSLKLFGKPEIKTIAIQKNKKILIGGKFSEINGKSIHSIARLKPNGELDSTFESYIKKSQNLEIEINKIKIQNNGKILVGCDITNNYHQKTPLIRLNTDGSEDISFNINLKTSFGGVKNIFIDSNNDIIVSGNINYLNKYGVFKLDNHGNVYDTFKSLPKTQERTIHDALKTKNNDFIVSGFDHSIQSGFIYKLDSNGNIDNSFGEGFDLNYYTIKSSLEFGNKLILGGESSEGGAWNRRISLLISDSIGKEVNKHLISVSNSKSDPAFYDLHKLNDEFVMIAGRFDNINGFEFNNFGVSKINGQTNPEFNLNITEYCNDIQYFDSTSVITAGNFGIKKIKTINSKPQILNGPLNFCTFKNKSITINLSDIEYSDIDDPSNNITLFIKEGENYTVQNNLLKPNKNFTGDLMVSLYINDGKDDSDVYMFTLPVKESIKPKIINTSYDNTSIKGSLEIVLDNIKVEDDDSEYPNNFKLSISNGNNYTTSNNIVYPNKKFWGKLNIPITVNDGEHDSDPYIIQINVEKEVGINTIITNNYSIYPNPFTNTLNIKQITNSKFKKLEIYNTFGLLVHSTSDKINKVNLDKLSPGIYILKITSNKSTNTFKLIKL